MAFLDTKHQRAALVIFALGALILWSLRPYATGIVGIPVLAVLFAPAHSWLVRHGTPSSFGAFVVTLLGAVLLIVPGVFLAGLLIGQAQEITQTVLQSPIIDRFRGLQFYVLKHPGDVWLDSRPYIPFSDANTKKLGRRFKDVTVSTVIGTGVVAAIQGALLGLAFWVAGLPNGLFWGVVTAAFAILPVVGSGLIWGPAAIVLYMQGRPIAAILLALWGAIIVGSVDNFIRPLIYRRFSAIHPLITLIGAIGGVSYFGLLGLLIGPLALSYFFELIRMYREEYLEPEVAAASSALT